ncbi:MAG: flagellar hook-length control protein FliK [Defluviitaleaceae bacterium]|nr:flagellar hook-length control protein FliK [Defluviitaleaceae bacterium]
MVNTAQTREPAVILTVPQRQPQSEQNQPRQNTQSNRDFDQFMASRDRESQAAANAPRERNRTRNESPSAESTRRAGQNRQQHNNSTNAETAPPTDRLPNGQETPETPPDTDTATAAETPTEETLEIAIPPEQTQLAILYIIAETLQIPPDQIIELAAQLQILPEELAEPATASKFLQLLLEVENPVELLVMPEYPEELQKVVETTQTAIAILETEPPAEVISRAATNLDRLNILGNLTTEVDENNNLVITERPQAAETAEPTRLSDGQATVVPQRLDAPLFPIAEQVSTETLQPTAAEPRIIRTETADNVAEYRPLDEIIPQAANERPTEVSQEIQPREVVVQVNPATTLANQAAALANIAETQQATSPTQVMQQIVTHIKTIAPETFTELRMTLRPEHLGDVTLRVAVQNGIVTAMFVAESQRIKEIIEANFNQLRNALEEQGISIAELFVSVNTGDNSDQTEQMSQYLKAQQDAMRRLQRAAGISAAETGEEEPEQTRILMDSTVEFTA